MIKRRLFLFLVVLFAGCNTYAQLKFDLKASHFIEIPSDSIIMANGQKLPTIGGISGIDYDSENDQYILISDAGIKNGNGRYYTADIDLNESVSLEFSDVVYLPNPELRGEGIRVMSSGMLMTDERTIDEQERSFLLYLDKDNEINEVALPAKYQKPMWDNSGFEGLALSESENKAFIALERAMPENVDRNMVSVLEYDLMNMTAGPIEYYYPLQRKMSGNGISEIVSLNDTTLIVIERDWVSPNNYVTLYMVNLNNTYENSQDGGDSTRLLKPVELFSFPQRVVLGGKPFKVNNIEGATFSADKEYLILVSDNNFGNKCNCTPTQFVFLKIE